jgi:CheY-like chemotaxis protein
MRDDDLTTARILIIDDQPSNVRLLERVLVTAGYPDLMSTLGSREVRAAGDRVARGRLRAGDRPHRRRDVRREKSRPRRGRP